MGLGGATARLLFFLSFFTSGIHLLLSDTDPRDGDWPNRFPAFLPPSSSPIHSIHIFSSMSQLYYYDCDRYFSDSFHKL